MSYLEERGQEPPHACLAFSAAISDIQLQDFFTPELFQRVCNDPHHPGKFYIINDFNFVINILKKIGIFTVNDLINSCESVVHLAVQCTNFRRLTDGMKEKEISFSGHICSDDCLPKRREQISELTNLGLIAK